jgi:hypothetical protein
MKPIAAVPFKSSFVVVCDDGSVHRYDKDKKRWIALPPLPGSTAANYTFNRKKKKRKPIVEETPLTPA